MPKRAKGTGSIREKTVKRSGKEYTYWEGRVTIGHDPKTGRQKQKCFGGKTREDVIQKMQTAGMSVTDCACRNRDTDKNKYGSLNAYLSIYKRDNFTCQDCGRVWKEGDTFNIHHIVPVSKGGGDELDNLILLCQPCHVKRHTKPCNQRSYEDILRDIESIRVEVNVDGDYPTQIPIKPLNKVNDFRVDPIGISVSHAAALIGVSKPKVYELMENEKDFPACRLGGRTIISLQGLREWFRGKVRAKV